MVEWVARERAAWERVAQEWEGLAGPYLPAEMAAWAAQVMAEHLLATFMAWWVAIVTFPARRKDARRICSELLERSSWFSAANAGAELLAAEHFLEFGGSSGHFGVHDEIG